MSSPDTIHYTEEVIGLDRRVTVIGTVCDKMGDLRIESTNDHKVIVSTKSVDDMVKDAEETKSSAKLWRVISIIIAIICIILGLCMLE